MDVLRLAMQICQQYTGSYYRKFKYRAKYVNHFRTSFGTEIPLITTPRLHL